MLPLFFTDSPAVGQGRQARLGLTFLCKQLEKGLKVVVDTPALDSQNKP